MLRWHICGLQHEGVPWFEGKHGIDETPQSVSGVIFYEFDLYRDCFLIFSFLSCSWGIRVNIRETERKRRAGTTSAALGPAGRRGSEEEEGDSHLSPGSGAGAQSQGHQIMDAPRRFLEGTAAQREKERGQRERAATARAASRPDGAGSSGKVKKAKRKRSPARKS